MREPLEWKDEYSVGVPELDRQHRRLIGLINRLSEESVDGVLMGWVFEALETYVKEHFSAEEAMLEAADYADLAEHRRRHRAFEQWLSAVRQTYSLGMTSPDLLAVSVNAFLRDWLVTHILSADMAYRDVLGGGQGSEAGGDHG